MGKDGVGHPDLVGGGETTLHTHAGGGGGPIVKTGTIITDSNGAGSVVFPTPFVDVDYAICFACEGSIDVVIATWMNKTVNGFDVRSDDDGGKAEPNTIVDWMAVSFSNP